MPKYEAGKSWWMPHLSRHCEVGEILELPEEDAEKYMQNEPGLLKPARETTQAHPQEARKRGRPGK